MRTAARLALGLGVLACLSASPARATQLIAPAGPPPAPVPPPPAPPPVAAPASACSTSGAAGDTWSMGPRAVGYTNFAPTPGLQVAVDPWTPCLMYRALSQQDLDRSTDGGVTWTNVLHDVATNPTTAASATQGEFAMRSITIPAPGVVVLGENGNGDAILISRDRGTTWHLSDVGVEGQPITSVTFAPSDPQVAYATVDGRALAGGPVGLYVSRDGGSSWSETALPRLPVIDPLEATGAAPGACPWNDPCETLPQVEVDPWDASHLYLLLVPGNQSPSGASGDTVSRAVILESSDAGLTWRPPISPPLPTGGNLQEFSQLLVTHTAAHGLRLYITNYVPTMGAPAAAPLAFMASASSPQNWKALPVAALPFGRLAADPTDGDRLHYAGLQTLSGLGNSGELVALGSYTTDGFDHVTATSSGLVTRTVANNLNTVLPARSVLGGGFTSDPAVVIQADRLGGFTYAAHAQCQLGASSQCYSPAPEARSPYEVFDLEAYLRYVPPDTAASRLPLPGAPKTEPSGGAASSSGQSAVRSAPPMTPLRTCQIPASQVGTQASSGSLTFDGANLLYTLPHDVAAPGQGLVRMMDPSTCAVTGAIDVRFDPQELGSVAQTLQEPSVASAPSISTLTYDPNHATLWFSLEYPTEHAHDIVPIFTARIVDSSNPAAPVALAQFHEFAPHYADNAEQAGQGEDLLTFDYSDDTVWRAVWLDGVPHDGSSLPSGQPGHVTAAGVDLPSCVNGVPANAGGTGLATWVVAGPGRLLVQDEDDRTITEVDAHTCAVLRVMQHLTFGEPLQENEQMACDALTFQSGNASSGGAATTAVWLRDATTQSIVAYALPDGACPMPTYTAYLSPHSLMSGSVTRFCASVVTHSLSGSRALPAGLPVTFSTASGQLAQAMTAGGPQVCTAPMTEPLPIGSSLVTAAFAGTSAYLKSSGTGAVQVLGAGTVTVGPNAVLPPVSGPGPGGPPSQPGPQINGASGTEPVTSAAAQGQAQAQAQTQSQAQAQSVAQVQPGVMVQRQKGAQVALQENTTARHTLQATALHRAHASFAGAAAAVLMLGFSILGWRPRRAVAGAARESPTAGTR